MCWARVWVCGAAPGCGSPADDTPHMGGEGDEAAVALQENERGLRSRAVGAEDEVGAVVAIEVNGEAARGVEGREGEVGRDVGDREGPRNGGAH